MKILFYVQHLLGIGHLRRASLLAEALVEAGAEVTVASGGFAVPGITFGGARIIQLPPARAADAAFSDVLDEAGRPVDAAWKAARTRRLVGAFETECPDALIVETYPFGRRRFRFELEPLLQAARNGGRTLIASSVRDILVGKANPDKEADMADRARRWFDLVMVHGDPALIAFGATFPFADRIADLIAYTGYVAAPAPDTDVMDAGGVGDEVVVSVGGGAVGGHLLETALSARSATPLAQSTWRFLLGPDVPEATAATLRRSAGPGIIVEPARADFAALLRRCRLSISQAGYNTVLDVLAARCPAVLVPFAAEGESEQSIRARLLADRGLVHMVAEHGLTARGLARTVAAAVASPPSEPPPIRMDGRETTVKLIFDGVRRQVRSIDGQW